MYNSKEMLELLMGAGYQFFTSSEKEIVRKIKETCCYIAPNYKEVRKSQTSNK